MFRSVRARIVSIAGVILAAGLVAGCSQSGGSAQPEGSAETGDPAQASSLVVAITPVTTSACVSVTQERGEFKRAGLDVTLVPAPPTSAAQIAQVLNGQVTVGLGAYTGVISAVSSGFDVVMTNASDYDYDKGGEAQTAFAVLVPKDSSITSFKDLEGKTVAVNSLQGTWELSLRKAIAEEGGDPTKVELVTVSFPDQGAALKANRVDAIFTLQPLVTALTGEGFTSIGDPFAIALGKPDPTSAVMFMSKEFVGANPDAANKFVDTMIEGNTWCNEHPDEMLDAIVKITKIPKEVLAKAPLPVFGAGIDTAETEAWIKLLVEYGVIPDAPAVEDVQWSDAPTR